MDTAIVTTDDRDVAVERRRTMVFYLLTFLISWSIWIPMSLLPGFHSDFLLMLGAFGPLTAAIVTAGIYDGRAGVRQWLVQAFRWRIPVTWILIGWLLLPFLMICLQLALYLLVVGPVTLQTTTDIPWYYVVAVYPLNILIAAPVGSGMGEEPGWQGAGVPGLVTRFHPLLATLVHGLVWATWHLPAYMTAWEGGGQPLTWFYAYVIPLSMIMYWLTRRAGGSVIPAILLHSATNLYSSFLTGEAIFAGSLATHFIEFKTVTYWTVALCLILATRGRLGTPATDDV